MTLTLAQVISRVESNDNPRAMRFEAGLFERWQEAPTPAEATLLVRIKAIHRCSLDTARMVACTSWGRYQLLGENIYDEGGYAGHIVDYLASDTEQLASFTRFVAERRINADLVLTDDGLMQKFAGAYNGPSNVAAYVTRMRQAMATLSG